MNTTALRPLLVPLLALPALAQGPFPQGELWSQHPASTQAWIPTTVQFAWDGNLAFASTEGLDPGWIALDVAREGPTSPRFEEFQAPQASLTHGSTAAREGDGLFVFEQLAGPTAGSRITQVTRFSGAESALAGSFTPAWSRDLAGSATGPAQLVASDTGEVLAVAAHDQVAGVVRLEVLAGATGEVLLVLDLPGLALTRLELSGNGSLLAVAAGLDLYFVDPMLGVVHHQALMGSLSSLSVSPGGDRVATGAIGQVVEFTQGVQGWAPAVVITRPVTEMATALALGGDGETTAAAWWRYGTGDMARFELTQRARVVAQLEQAGSPFGLQNLPRAIDIDAQSRRAAFGTWGNGVDPEVVLLEVGRPSPVASYDLDGSAVALDLDAAGCRLLVASKDTHMAQFATRGAVRLFDTGEGNLRQEQQLELGTVSTFRTFADDATLSLLLLGQRANPVELPGILGSLHLDRQGLIVLPAVPSAGFAEHQVQVPSDPAWVGLSVGVQAAYRTPSGTRIGSDVLDPVVF